MTMRTPPDLLQSAAAAPASYETAARILPLVDLTALGEDESTETVTALCERGLDAGVAAVCVWPRFLPIAKAKVAHSPVRLVTVANFPDGSDDIARAARETADALLAGADEVDVVAPVQAILDGDVGLVGELVQACRDKAPERILKVVLETGRLDQPARIAAAARAAIMAGADMLKTSTGKGGPGASLEAAAVLLAVIEEAEGKVGLKVSGGIRTTQQAAQYLYLADHFMGRGWTRPETLRFGGSALLDDLLRLLAVAPERDDDDDGNGE
ncbi:MAG: deoC [Geminicoccaceae bacterium]|nr:deoC [Geminicoccaceae bacterium]